MFLVHTDETLSLDVFIVLNSTKKLIFLFFRVSLGLARALILTLY